MSKTTGAEAGRSGSWLAMVLGGALVVAPLAFGSPALAAELLVDGSGSAAEQVAGQTPTEVDPGGQAPAGDDAPAVAVEEPSNDAGDGAGDEGSEPQPSGDEGAAGGDEEVVVSDEVHAVRGAASPPAVRAEAVSPLITITESGGSTWVHPDDAAPDSYTIQLAQPPTAWVCFTITTATPTSPSFAQISVDGGANWASAAVLVFNAGEVGPKTVLVRWADPNRTLESIPQHQRTMTVSHSAESWDDLRYDFVDGRNVYVNAGRAPIDPADLELDFGDTGTETVAGVALPLEATLQEIATEAPVGLQGPITFESSEPSDAIDNDLLTATKAGPRVITAKTLYGGVEISAEHAVTVTAAAAAELDLTPSRTTVDQGDSVDFTVSASDEFGNPVSAAGAVLTSDVSTDVVDGFTVTFPTASPHRITATLGAASDWVDIEVVPSDETPVLEATGGPGAGIAPLGWAALAAGSLLIAAGGARRIHRAERVV